ncbi:class I SAM-dependent methyltransferase [Luteimonas sp. R10]|uniref:class I SAM-dependent methyltransferase n=1 Tax=Luteimonas sp. R10 TaxID=3108176 RepID=UPI003086C59D|nr:class I SAM-dependent methyltransferase [Luteimonas sp. R10]
MFYISTWRGLLTAGLCLIGASFVLAGFAYSSILVAAVGLACWIVCAHSVAVTFMRRLRQFAEKTEQATLESVLAIHDIETAISGLSKRLTGVEQASERAEKSFDALKSTVMTRVDKLENHAKRIDRSVNDGQKQQVKLKVDTVREFDAILQIRALLEPDGPTPYFGGWAMDSMSVLRIAGEILRRRPRLVVECGSGASSFWLSKALERTGGGRLLAFEHLREYQEDTVRFLAGHRLDHMADVLFVPLCRMMVGDEPYDWYDLSQVHLQPGSIDVLLVDGPPGSTGPLARYPALPMLHPFMAEGALVIVDDTIRKEEQEIVERWAAQYELKELGSFGERTMAFQFGAQKGALRLAELAEKAA